MFSVNSYKTGNRLGKMRKDYDKHANRWGSWSSSPFLTIEFVLENMDKPWYWGGVFTNPKITTWKNILNHINLFDHYPIPTRHNLFDIDKLIQTQLLSELFRDRALFRKVTALTSRKNKDWQKYTKFVNFLLINWS